MEENQQKYFFIAIILGGLLLLALGIGLNPNVVYPTMHYLGLAINAIIFLIISITMLLGPGVVAFFGRLLVENRDQVVARHLEIPGWGHWLIAIIFGIAFGFLWTSVVPFLVNLPTWVLTLYTYMDWITKINEITPISWGIWGLIIFMIGYGAPKVFE
ncbi:MAG: hypothetical protein UW68_C0052G0004 [Candidatus Collierbacteria bacterium GW2011_GWB1_44_6]|uniref:Uncharacterized protein n=1 Tax=Candidatus Collierbacteria bacterium GW2011_GWB1_44_6 TaxID=1618384 RepID=A0A0G1MIW4_9BACT|nr:MAG: hypothetical protein UW68_C0052G0004 [Candidatus Collierbacteria bacterium GW2011_GWB1_44_6]